MPMAFVGQARRHARRRWRLAELADNHELLTFQRGSQPHVALLDLCRRQGIEAPRVHAISSISAMVQLVESGFGVATLPQAAVPRLAQPLGLKVLNCEAALTPLPIHLSWRDDPGSPVAGPVLESLLQFNRTPSSKKSMKA
jgi:DNA-binding transcriptional LysR family regulator